MMTSVNTETFSNVPRVRTFRVHYNDVTIEPFDIDACEIAEVRDRMTTLRPGKLINKIKAVRQIRC